MKYKKFVLPILLYLLVNSLYSQAFIRIPNIYTAVEIDGVQDNIWSLLEENEIIYQIDGTNYPQTNDCSGYFKAFWNNDSLYVLIFAKDDFLYTNDPTVYLNDGFEIYINVNNVKDTVYTVDCYQFRFTPGSNDITGRHGINYLPIPPVKFAIDVNEGSSRTIEAVFPLVDVLGKLSNVQVDDTIGFEIEILDNDGSGREHVLSWNNNEHMAWYNPAKMGIMVFGENMNSFAGYKSDRPIIYPIPANKFAYIESENPINSWSVYSIQGQLVNSEYNIHQTEVIIPINNLNAGIYLLQIKYTNGQINSCMLIKN